MTSTSHSDFVVGGLDDSNNCKTGTFHNVKTGKSFWCQTAMSVLEISLSEENSFVSESSGEIRLSEGHIAKASDLSVMDSMRGTYMWEKMDSECPETLVQLCRGDLKFFVNSTEAGSFVGGLAVLDKDDQVSGLELISPLLLCSHAAWKTHLTRIFVVFHGDNFTSIASLKIEEGGIVSTDTRVESELSFLHIKGVLGQKETVKCIRLSICENRREVLMTRLESIL